MKFLLEQRPKLDRLNLDREVASTLIESGANPNTPYLDSKGKRRNLIMDSIIVENNSNKDNKKKWQEGLAVMAKRRTGGNKED